MQHKNQEVESDEDFAELLEAKSVCNEEISNLTLSGLNNQASNHEISEEKSE